MNRIITGDVLTALKEIKDGTVNTCVTSPPYYGLRDYGTASWEGGDPACDHQTARSRCADIKEGDKQGTSAGSRPNTQTACKCGAKRIDAQIGLEQSPEEYVEKMVAVFDEVKRVLKKDGTIWLNLGDSYAGNCSRVSSGRAGYGEEREGVYEKGGNGHKPKDLIGIPWMVANALREPRYTCAYCGKERRLSRWARWDNGAFQICGSCGKRCVKQPERTTEGLYLRQDIIWAKPNPMPESVTDRCTKAHEYIFLFSKTQKYYFDQEAIMEPITDSSAIRLLQNLEGQKGSDRVPGKNNGTMKAVGRKPFDFTMAGGGNGVAGHSGYTKADGTSSLKPTRNKRSVWTVTTKPFSRAHFATFPEDLITPCILAGAPRGGLVLDPFMGAGTTAVVAKANGRNYIGTELNPEYVKIAENRLMQTMGSLL